MREVDSSLLQSSSLGNLLSAQLLYLETKTRNAMNKLVSCFNSAENVLILCPVRGTASSTPWEALGLSTSALDDFVPCVVHSTRGPSGEVTAFHACLYSPDPSVEESTLVTLASLLQHRLSEVGTAVNIDLNDQVVATVSVTTSRIEDPLRTQYVSAGSVNQLVHLQLIKLFFLLTQPLQPNLKWHEFPCSFMQDYCLSVIYHQHAIPFTEEYVRWAAPLMKTMMMMNLLIQEN